MKNLRKIGFYGTQLLLLAAHGSLHCMERPQAKLADDNRSDDGRVVRRGLGSRGVMRRGMRGALGLAGMGHKRSGFRADWLGQAKEQLAARGNVYEVEPHDALASLDEKYVMNDYWKAIAASPNQDVKDTALGELLSINFSNAGYYLKRYHIAAAVYAGANPKATVHNPLLDAVLHNDYALCQLLLDRGCSQNDKFYEDPVLFHVKTVELARLFLHYNACVHARGYLRSLLSRSLGVSYEGGLIRLYKRAGLVVQTSDNYKSLLVDLALFSIDGYSSSYDLQLLEEKIHALLEDVPHQNIVEMVHHRPHPAHGSVLEILHQNEAPAARLLEKLIRSYLAKHKSVSA